MRSLSGAKAPKEINLWFVDKTTDGSPVQSAFGMVAGVSGPQETISAKVLLEKRALGKASPGQGNLRARALVRSPYRLAMVVTAALGMQPKWRIAT